jgi:hypothetical protein
MWKDIGEGGAMLRSPESRIQRRLGRLARRLRGEAGRLEALARRLPPVSERDSDAIGEGERSPTLTYYLLGALEIYAEELRRLAETMATDQTMTAEELRRRWLEDRGGGPPAPHGPQAREVE